ncbi:MAG: hypothetical protein C0467_05980 [Planctomycetaceae bacterium]|nr:hypothetical protein [Planctomycetaceae bacterium]
MICTSPALPVEAATASLVPCTWCAGACWEPSEEGSPIPCMECDGGGWQPQVIDLGASRSYRSRTIKFNPGTGDLIIIRVKAKKPAVERYTLREMVPDQVIGGEPGRAFECNKLSSGDRHHIWVSRHGWTCDCGAKSWEASARGNARAYYAGDQQFATAGCTHLDAIKSLLTAGLLDLPRESRTKNIEAIMTKQEQSDPLPVTLTHIVRETDVVTIPGTSIKVMIAYVGLTNVVFGVVDPLDDKHIIYTPQTYTGWTVPLLGDWNAKVIDVRDDRSAVVTFEPTQPD